MKRDYKKKENYVISMDYEQRKKHINSVIFKEYSNLMNGCVLYLGCNNGSSLFILRDHCSSLYGLDINEEAISIARKELARRGMPDITLISSNILNIPIENNFFDNIYALHIMEHIYMEDMDDALKEIKRVVKKDGHLIFEFPTPNSRDYNNPEHVFFFDSEETIKEVIGPHFKIKQIMVETRENPGMPGKHNNWRVICQK